MAEDGRVLRDMIVSCRSKNAGPFSQTFDFFFGDETSYRFIVDKQVINSDLVARLYGIDAGEVKISCFEPALAIKVAIPRRMPGGSPGDRDVAGGQQFAPFLSVAVD